ncbi:MAG: S26 family signal peptidase, partial [Janthinobacterium lividum]
MDDAYSSSRRAQHLARAEQHLKSVSIGARIVVGALLIAGGLRSLVLEPFNIPSESMLPTLLAGDYLFVAKWPYGLGRYSLPLALPLFDGR